MNDLNLKEVTNSIKEVLTNSLDSSKYKLNIDEYSWCVTIYICNLEDCHLHEIAICRLDHDGNFGIGIPDYDGVRYLVKGNLSELNDEVVHNFFAEWNKEIDYQVKSLKGQVCEYEEMKIARLLK